MSKVKAKFRKGSFRTRVTIVTALLAALLLVVSSMTAFALDLGNIFGKATFTLTVGDKSGGKNDDFDGKVTASLTETLNFQADKAFVPQTLSKVYYLVIETKNMGTSQATSLTRTSSGSNSNWSMDTSLSPTTAAKYTYSSSSAINTGSFDSIMSQFSVTFNSGSTLKNGYGTVTISGYEKDPSKNNKPLASYTCRFEFYEYAEGDADASTAAMDYKAQYAKDYDIGYTYTDAVPEGKATAVLVNSPDAAGGKAEFDLYLSQKGGGYKAQIGYQIKKKSEAWSSAITPVWVYNIDDIQSARLSQPYHISVDGLDADTTYVIRGLIATDGKTSSPKYTSELTFQYQKPVINSFTFSGDTHIFRGGESKVNLSTLVTFNDQNGMNRTSAPSGDGYVGADGQEHTGPALLAEVFFTDNRVTESGSGGLQDKSVWYKINDTKLTYRKEMVTENADGTKTVANTLTLPRADADYWRSYDLPSSLSDLKNSLTTSLKDEINSTTCAFKLVVTDLFTGYSAVAYSDNFTIDSSAPGIPTVTATVRGKEVPLTKEDPQVVGGSGGQVSVHIGNADDGKGSGIKNYSYSMYSLSSSAVPSHLTSTEEILEELSTYTEASHGNAEYKSWTVLSSQVDEDGNPVDNMSELVIARDGYYRIIARAEDEAGFLSDTVDAYLRVDLTAPTAPVLRLAKQVDEDGVPGFDTDSDGYPVFKQYDNRTYTDSTVWAFAYSEPLTAKTIDHFMYSTNGGLTWTSMENVPEFSNGTRLKIEQIQNPTKKAWTFADNNCSVPDEFLYQVGLNLTGLGLNDYVSVLFKAVDSLGNESAVSNERHIRTLSEVKAVASVSHDPIEVAMALGNTNLSMEKNLVPLKMKAAQIINEKYYGTTGTIADKTASDFNPYLYIKNKNHTCKYATDSATGPCTISCPYDEMEEAGYSIYKPEWINISGLVSGVEGATVTEWNHYQHNTDPNYQNKANGDVLDLGEEGYIPYWTDSNARQNSSINDYNYNNTGKGTEDFYVQRSAANMQGTVLLRRRHIVDSSGRTLAGTTYSGQQGDWANITFMGYGSTAKTDWLLHHFTQNTNKSIMFTVDVSKGSFHTYHQAGFWFNTTIRETVPGNNNWVVSGYRLMIVATGSGGWTLKDCTGRTANCQVQIQYFEDQPVKDLMDSGGMTINNSKGSARFATRTMTPASSSNKNVQTFLIDLTGTTCSVYQYATDTDPGKLSKSFMLEQTCLFSNVNTPRPYVNGHQIGESAGDPTNPFMDTDCFGFGPVIGYSTDGGSHTCDQETRIVFSNVGISYNLGRTLSEVVTEPAWGDGKSRFILNLSNNSQDDFKEPALTAQIQWRLKNDNAKYIGWGYASMHGEVTEFLKRMAGSEATDAELRAYGMYEDLKATGETGTDQEITDIATYITEQYYAELGYDATGSSGTVKDQVSPSGGAGKGISFTFDNIGNINFTVDPPERAESSANPDFPSGRWLMVHDATGMGLNGDEARDKRSGSFSDALQTDLTLPGRYAYYFAPLIEKYTDPTTKKDPILDPNEAIFDFVVNQPPVSSFLARIVDENGQKVMKVDDFSYDPDCADAENPVTVDGVQLSGIDTVEYRYSLLVKENGDTKTVVDTKWSAASPDGMTLAQLTNNKYTTALPDGAVFTVYQRVTDIVTRRVLKSDGSGYTYVKMKGDTHESSANATEGADITFAPTSKLSVSAVTMYDTAENVHASGREITLTRESSHVQERPFAPSWHLYIAGVTDKLKEADEEGFIEMTADGDYNYSYNGKVVLTCTAKPDEKGNKIGGKVTGADGKEVDKHVQPSEGGSWKISYETIKEFVDGKTGTSIKLQLRESSWGVSTQEALKAAADGRAPVEAFISDKTGRAIKFEKDTRAPSSQLVLTSQLVNGKVEDYAASTYLEVTNGQNFVLIDISGSSDDEGVLGGYAYYFYDRNTNGSEKAGAYYQMQPDGSLKAKTTIAEALTKVVSDKVDSANGVDLTDGTQIRIGLKAMRSEDSPTDSLNVAIFAYDNATGRGTPSGGNETTKTRITDIKLSRSKPAPPAISVTNTMNQSVAYIGNENGFQHGDPTKDVQTSALQNFSGTDVNVQFIPSKAKYSQDINGDWVKMPDQNAAGGTEFYQDWYQKADLTGVANINYVVEYKTRETDPNWTIKDQMNGSAPANQLTFRDDGVYQITASVVNGSGTVGDPRTVRFTIDKTAPTGLQVQFLKDDGSTYSGEWVRSVTITAYNAFDTNADSAWYQYSQDGGKTWIDMAPLTSSNASVTMQQSGEYVVQVRAIDRAGNELLWPVSTRVRIDTDAPETVGPTLTADSVMRDIYDSYVISAVYDSQGGTVEPVDLDWNGLDKSFVVPTEDSLRIKVKPNDGYILSSVVYRGRTIPAEQLEYDTVLKCYYVDIEEVTADGTLTVNFVKTDLTAAQYNLISQSVFAMQYAAGVTFNALDPDSVAKIDLPMAIDEDDTPGTDKPVYSVEVYDLGFGGVAKVDGYERVEVTEGTDVLLTIEADEGYRVKEVNINGNKVDHTSMRESTSYYAYQYKVTRNTVINVTYEQIPTRIMKLDVGDCVTAKVVSLDSFETVELLSDGSYRVPVGIDVMIQMTLEDGFKVSTFTIDGVTPSGYDGSTAPSYHVPAGTAEIMVKIDAEVAGNSFKFNVFVRGEETGEGHGTITAHGDSVQVPRTGSRTFTITPDPTYKVSQLLLTTRVGGEDDTVDEVNKLVETTGPNGQRQYTYTLTNPSSSGTLEVVFTQQTYTLITRTLSGSGSVSVRNAQEGAGLNVNRIPEGTKLIITPAPKDGYRLKSVTLTETDSQGRPKVYTLGAASTYEYEIRADVIIDAEFEQRTVTHIVTEHAITAVANNIKDKDDTLHDEPYRFRISDAPIGTVGAHTSDWSAWSESNTITYTNITLSTGEEIALEPNRPYYVYLMTRDRVGNASDGSHYSVVYTMGNMPGIGERGVETLDDTGKSLKSVLLYVDPNGNPEDTEYLVYVSYSNSMADMFVANKTDDNDVEDCWKPLGLDNTFYITGLVPGRWHYFQVVARNHDKHSTEVSRDIVGIMLSPAAPPENSFYFVEQASPIAPVILRWEQPEGEVKSVQIYRDGMFLKEVDATTTQTYVDEKVNFPGDALVTYSYAFVNSAGVGSTRVAVSEEYYRAYEEYLTLTTPPLTEDGEPEPGWQAPPEETLAQTKYRKMTALKEKIGYENLYSETMTYPVFQYGAKEPISASATDDNNSGRITVQMNYDASVSGRQQKYFLRLEAHKMKTELNGDPVLDENGNPTYEEEPDTNIKNWDSNPADYDAQGNQIPKETFVRNTSGEAVATATWQGLNTMYGYMIYVDRIESTGKYERTGATPNLGGQQSAGVEYTLGKKFTVDKTGFGFEYTNEEAKQLLDTEKAYWKSNDLEEYLRFIDTDWEETPVNSSYISFNKSPQIELAGKEDRYYDNDEEKVQKSGDDYYLLIDQSMSNKTFHINVAAWDPDGSRADSMLRPSVKGSIASASGTAPAFAAGEEMPRGRETAMERANLYAIEFDGSGLSTGIYKTMVMKAADCDTETTETTNDIMLVVNRNTPKSSVAGGTTKLLENETVISKADLVQSNATAATDSAASESLSEVALMVMAEQYKAKFGTSDYKALHAGLCEGSGNTIMLNAAKELLGTTDSANSKYVNTNGTLTEDGFHLAIARMTPPITRYITITKAQYDKLAASNATEDLVFEDVNTKTGVSTYWLDLNYALDHAEEDTYCTWLEKVGEDNVKPNVDLKYDENSGQPIDKENTYQMKVVAHFGGNTSSQTVDFVIRQVPSAVILSQKKFTWQDTAESEYKIYADQGYTIDLVEKSYNGCYDPETVLRDDPAPDPSDPAYTTREVNGRTVYSVYKLIDLAGNVGSDFITGSVRTNLGIYSQLDEVGVLLVMDQTFNPNDGGTSPGSIEALVQKNANNTPITENGDLRFSTSGLEPGTRYYLWSFYKAPGASMRVYSKSYVALTTDANLPLAQYGFSRESYSYKEVNHPSATNYGFNVSKMGSREAYAPVKITATYYEADQYGNLLKDDNGDPIPLTGDALTAAQETLHFQGGTGKEFETTLTIPTNQTSGDVYMVLQDNNKQQGHMIVRLTLEVDYDNMVGYCYVANGGGYTDIFVQDDESPVTEYRLGVINQDENGDKFMDEVVDVSTGLFDRYEYQFKGLPVDYSQISTVTLTYENLGTGDLEDISVTVYEDREGKKVSEYFEAEPPTETNLKLSLGGTGTVEIHPKSGLPDGVYEGWVFLTAQYVEEPVRIKVLQVVGQSTLRGRIYITPEMPGYNVYTGSAKISLYDADTWDNTNKVFLAEPLYVTESNPYGGEYEIPNILNRNSNGSSGRYYAVVERDGFLTFNTAKGRPLQNLVWLELTTTSKTYTYNLRLIGGDIDGNQVINNLDMDILVKYYNRLAGMPGNTEEDERYIRACDFNQDGVVNALDRMYLTSNLGLKDSSYPYGTGRSDFVLQPDA